MPTLLWDASALTKRYVAETGSDTVNALFTLVPADQMVTTVLGYAETYSILVRKKNDGRLDEPTFTTASSALKIEVINSPDFSVLNLEYDAVLDSIELIQKHNINASDAVILVIFLRYAQAASLVGEACLLIASDQRLLRAAAAEGLNTLNPETLPATDVPMFLTRV